MSDVKGEAQRCYVKLQAHRAENIGISSDENDAFVDAKRKEIMLLLCQFLTQCRPQERFRFNEFPNIIQDNSRMENFDPIKAADAFLNLENYLVLLYLMPWKQEYHKIKKYGGFYKTKVESHLRSADAVLKLIGFSEKPAGLLVLSLAVRPELLQIIAFECMVAAVECQIIDTIWKTIDQSMHVTLSQIVQMRLKNSGSVSQMVALIEAKVGGSEMRGGDNITIGRLTNNTLDGGGQVVSPVVMAARSPGGVDGLTDPFRNKLKRHMETVQKLDDVHKDIPYMDDSPKGFDDHLMASLQIVGEKEASPHLGVGCEPQPKMSQEWSFVREGLEKKYGKSYYDGIRKDILETEGTEKKKEGKYVEVVAKHIYENTGSKIEKVNEIERHRGVKNTPNVNFDHNSGYNTETVFPPTIVKCQNAESFNSYQRKQVTDTVMRTRVQSGPTKKSHTAPIMSRMDSENGSSLKSMTYPPRLTPEAGKQPHPPSFAPQGAQLPLVHKKGVVQTNSFDSFGSSSGFVSAQTHTNNGSKIGATDSALFSTRTTVSGMSQASMIKKSQSSKWACSHCTYINKGMSSVCEMCSKSRDGIDVDSPTAGYRSKICDQCTLENTSDSESCSACGHHLRGEQTVV